MISPIRFTLQYNIYFFLKFIKFGYYLKLLEMHHVSPVIGVQTIAYPQLRCTWKYSSVRLLGLNNFWLTSRRSPSIFICAPATLWNYWLMISNTNIDADIDGMPLTHTVQPIPREPNSGCLPNTSMQLH